MMNSDFVIRDEYFNWLYDLVCGDRYSTHISFKRLLSYLHSTDFRYLISKDQNRAEDGISLRRRFALDTDYPDNYDYILNALIGPCSVFEMMVALAIRCEEDIMDDPMFGNRTGQWFWGMITSLGLGSMTDNRFDERYVYEIIERFLDRDYRPDGQGGLFTIRHCDYDLRDIEIWRQLCWYLNSIT